MTAARMISDVRSCPLDGIAHEAAEAVDRELLPELGGDDADMLARRRRQRFLQILTDIHPALAPWRSALWISGRHAPECGRRATVLGAHFYYPNL
ncbi:hypothetical protein [Bradyrhizobium sp. CCGUVB23]|uniref:hypothetical protein n=1 Tax=Bradyrhizobium sp. CCGUVB23 TaxID=2949630 RepID=UPI0020B375E3|nr:hypothetical protein [Bradyrhizobium sp. CCGUVB23]MCP3466401.1 hypothetical protein [Bradyrhizobium sp. CCGUVB23]